MWCCYITGMGQRFRAPDPAVQRVR